MRDDIETSRQNASPISGATTRNASNEVCGKCLFHLSIRLLPRRIPFDLRAMNNIRSAAQTGPNTASGEFLMAAWVFGAELTGGDRFTLNAVACSLHRVAIPS
jgi:hypothetical protein